MLDDPHFSSASPLFAGEPDGQGPEAVQSWVDRGLSLSEALYRVLWLDIVTGIVGIGERLSERDLSVRYGASRTPVREVLHRLHTEGLLITTARGLTVDDASPAEIMDGWAIREEMLCIVVRLAIERSWTEDIDQLRTLIARLKQAVFDEDLLMALKLTLAFDGSLFRAAHSRAALRVFSASIGPPGRISRMLNDQARLRAATAEREAILDAVAARDADAAIAAVRTHADNGRRHRSSRGV